MLRSLIVGLQSIPPVHSLALRRSVTTSAYKVDTSDLQHKFTRSSGPGGQNVNKVSTKVELRLKVASVSWLPEDIKTKLLQQEANNVNKEGELIVVSQMHRTQEGNYIEAVKKLQAMVDQAAFVPEGPSEEKQAKVAKLMAKAKAKEVEWSKQQKRKSQERQSKHYRGD